MGEKEGQERIMLEPVWCRGIVDGDDARLEKGSEMGCFPRSLF